MGRDVGVYKTGYNIEASEPTVFFRFVSSNVFFFSVLSFLGTIHLVCKDQLF